MCKTSANLGLRCPICHATEIMPEDGPNTVRIRGFKVDDWSECLTPDHGIIVLGPNDKSPKLDAHGTLWFVETAPGVFRCEITKTGKRFTVDTNNLRQKRKTS